MTAQVVYGSAKTWLSSWVPFLHFVQGRIKTLSQLADDGLANRLSHNMVYSLFADKLVDYAEKYRGMRSVVLHGLEAFADVTIKATDMSGTWTVPPFFIDSVCHLAGFVMNVSDTMDTKNNFCVTPGWGSLRMARPLVAGTSYRSYVKMIPTAEDASIYLGDVYVLQGDEIVGVMQAMKFRRYPRVLLNRFFLSPDTKSSLMSGADVPDTSKLAHWGFSAFFFFVYCRSHQIKRGLTISRRTPNERELSGCSGKLFASSTNGCRCNRAALPRVVLLVKQ